jgi:hypothetical protein
LAQEPVAEAVPVSGAGPVAETGLGVAAPPVAEAGLPLDAGLDLAQEQAPHLG